MFLGPVYVLVYCAAMVAANLIVWWLGPWVSPINSFFLIGLDLTLRDKIHDHFNGNPFALAIIVLVACLATYFINPAADKIAAASAISFSAAALVDWLAYTLLRGRSWMQRVNGSNVAGAAVDSVLFPSIAFGVFMPAIIALQFAAKVGGGALWSIFFRRVSGCVRDAESISRGSKRPAS